MGFLFYCIVFVVVPFVQMLFLGALRIALFLFQILLANGANVDVAKSSGTTPLSIATIFKHPHVVNQLIDAGKEESLQMLQILS